MRELANPDPRVEEDHNYQLISNIKVVVPTVVLNHPCNLFIRKCVYEHFLLLHIFDSLGDETFGVAFVKSISAQAFHGLEQVIYIRRL